MKYNYDAELEAFVRVDGNGKKFYINSVEAQRIVTLRELGYSYSAIARKIDFASKKVGESSIKNFLKNVDEGNIEVYGDYPAPTGVIESIDDNDRISRLEDRVTELENVVFANDDNKSITNKVREWFQA